MITVGEFLAARLDDAQAVALAAQGTTRGIWKQVDPGREPGRIEDDYGDAVTHDESSPDEAQGRHIAANDPAHVLADIAAKRAILAIHEQATADESSIEPLGCKACHYDRGDSVQYGWGWCDTVRLLASTWTSHPDYRTEWAPAP